MRVLHSNLSSLLLPFTHFSVILYHSSSQNQILKNNPGSSYIWRHHLGTNFIAHHCWNEDHNFFSYSGTSTPNGEGKLQLLYPEATATDHSLQQLFYMEHSNNIFKGTIGRTVKESTPWWPEFVKPEKRFPQCIIHRYWWHRVRTPGLLWFSNTYSEYRQSCRRWITVHQLANHSAMLSYPFLPPYGA